MIYHYRNKRTGEALVFGSLIVIPDYTTLTLSKVNEHFSRKKEIKYEDHEHLIHKLLGIIRSKRKNYET